MFSAKFECVFTGDYELSSLFSEDVLPRVLVFTLIGEGSNVPGPDLSAFELNGSRERRLNGVPTLVN